MKENELQQIEARANAATPGPWVAHKYGHEADTVRQAEWIPCGEPGHEDCAITQTVHDVSVSLNSHSDGRARKNAAFIAGTRQDVPDLIIEVRRLRAALMPFADYANWDGADEFEPPWEGDPPFPIRMKYVDAARRALGLEVDE